MKFLTVLAVLLGLAAQSRGGDSWPQFRGPDGQGHSDAVGLPTTWTDEENVAWKTAIEGRGWSSPVIAGDAIWITTALDEGHHLLALKLDRNSGQIVLSIPVFTVETPQKINEKNSYASPTPLLEGNRVWVHFGTYGTACLESDTGKILWTNRDLQLDHREGPGSTPILYRDLFIVHCDGTDVQYIVALDKNTGQIVWKTERSAPDHPAPDQRKAYATPLVIEAAGRTQLLSPAAQRLSSYDPNTGAELWYVEYDGFSNVPRPLYSDGLVVFCTGYMKPQMWAVRPDGSGNVTETHVAWRSKAPAPANPSPVIVGQNIFVVSDQGVLSTVDVATGKERGKVRLGGNYSASPIAAEGRIYVCSEEGETIVFEAADKPVEIARNHLDERIMASPAVVGRAIYLRTETHLYRLEERAVPAAAAAR